MKNRLLFTIFCACLTISSLLWIPALGKNEPFGMLVFTKTKGYRHKSIPDGVAALDSLGRANGFRITHTEDAAQFTTENLARYRVVSFLSTSGDVLNPAQQRAFERYIQNGGAFVGIHAASDTEYDWPWYGGLVGAYFDKHPKIQSAVLHVSDTTHVSTHGLPNPWHRRDEWYNFRTQPEDVHALITVDETSYTGGTMGLHHPLSWYHIYQNGRSWYTAMGHTQAAFREPLFLKHILGGILWAANQSE